MITWNWGGGAAATKAGWAVLESAPAHEDLEREPLGAGSSERLLAAAPLGGSSTEACNKQHSAIKTHVSF